MNLFKRLTAVFMLLVVFSCQKETLTESSAPQDCTSGHGSLKLLNSSTLIEDFETGTKASYAAADVVLSTGTWNLNEALIGNTASDAKAGTQSARVRNSGKLTMKFDYTFGAGTVSVKHARYGTDASGTWQLWYSTDGGLTYLQSGSTISTTTATIQTATFTINVSGNVRLDIRKTDGGTNRINFDDITIGAYSGNNAAPILNSISPASASAGGAAFTLTATGTNFINGSAIQWNGVALTTTFVSSTSLTASVPAANIASVGTASVTVFTPAPGGGTSSAKTFTINTVAAGPKKFLFDATKAEQAGNADWVIDENSNVAVRFPTPAQSGITFTTSETFWTGAISAWGVTLVKAGHSVETLPVGTALTYGNASNAQDLSNYHVFVVDELNKVFTAAEKTAILTFVQNGGGLLMIADHTISDRNNDGWDSPEIWNDLMTNNTVQNNPFGFSIDLTNITQVTSNVWTGSSTNPILNGSQGGVSQLEFNNGATLTLNPAANPNVQGLIWKSTATQNNSNVMCASSTFGTGRVFVVTDSSPMDDGTGAAGNNLFVSWPLYSHAKLFMNASLWLAKVQ